MGPILIIHCEISCQGQRSRSEVKYVTQIDDISQDREIRNICRREAVSKPKCPVGGSSLEQLMSNSK